MAERTYIAIDLKSFYASSECAELGFDPLSTHLVVADQSRTDKASPMHRTVFSCIQHIREFEQLFDTPDMPSAPKDSTKTANCSLRLVGLNGSEPLVSMVLEGALACQLNSKTSTRNAVFLAFGVTRTPPDSPTSACTRCSIVVRKAPALSRTITVISSVIAERVC